MVTYSYKCSVCGLCIDEEFTFGEAPEAVHRMCDKFGMCVAHTRIFTVPALSFRGDGWGGSKRAYPSMTVSLEEARRSGYKGPDPRAHDVDPKDFSPRTGERTKIVS
jgi:predicted nucleic acid-binding Zn ribbon protein